MPSRRLDWQSLRQPVVLRPGLSTFIGLADRVEQRVLFANCDRFADVVNQRTGFYAITGTDLDKLEPQDFVTIRA
jgi:hypothetical protein